MWHYQLELPSSKGKRRQLRRGGFATQTEAQEDLLTANSLLAIPDGDDLHAKHQVADLLLAVTRRGGALPTAEHVRRLLHTGLLIDELPTVSAWLDDWLAGRRSISRGTIRNYESHIRIHLRPHLTHVRIDKLRVGHIQAIFDAIEKRNTYIRAAVASGNEEQLQAVRGMRVVKPATMHRIRATLRKALNDAIRQQLITWNPACYVELPSARRPKALIWTDERVKRWKDTGEIPSPVMVWTPQQTGQFLDHATGDRLYGLYHLTAFTGLRRGEACGMHWADLNLNEAYLYVRWQIIQIGWATMLAPVKTHGSESPIPLDTGTIQVLREHQQRQETERIAVGAAWHDTGLAFTTALGTALHPCDVTDRFVELAENAGLPPIRLHDLRHGAATLTLAAGADMKIVQELLRHSSITITADTYTSVLPDLARTAAEKAAQLVPRARSGDRSN